MLWLLRQLKFVYTISSSIWDNHLLNDALISNILLSKTASIQCLSQILEETGYSSSISVCGASIITGKQALMLLSSVGQQGVYWRSFVFQQYGLPMWLSALISIQLWCAYLYCMGKVCQVTCPRLDVGYNRLFVHWWNLPLPCKGKLSLASNRNGITEIVSMGTIHRADIMSFWSRFNTLWNI